MPRDTQRPCEENGQKWTKRVGQTFLSRSLFWSLWIFHNCIGNYNYKLNLSDYRLSRDLWSMLLLGTVTWTPGMEALRLARSHKLQERVWEWSGTLASATSLLVTCFRGQRPEGESLSWLCLWSMWIEALLETMRFLRTQIRDCRIWSDWKCNGPLPLVMPALSRLEKALQRLLFQLVRYSFCGICGNELEGLALIAWGQKSLFPRWPTLLLSHLLGMVTPRGTSWLFFIPFMTHHFYCGQDCTQTCAQAEGWWMLPLVVLAWETFQKTTLIHSGWHQRRRGNQTKVLVVRN